MPKIISYISVIIILFGVIGRGNSASAWFGAGKTPGIPSLASGLEGEIELPIYKFSPDFYSTSDTVSLNTQLINPTTQIITTPVFVRIYKVTQALSGTDVSDGEPSTPGLNENQLFSLFQSGNMMRTLQSSTSVGNFTVPADGTALASATFLPNQSGYYQFVFSTTDSDVALDSGTLITTGFFRVLSPQETASPTPLPSSTPNPSASPTPIATLPATPSPTPGTVGKQSALILSTPNCSNRNTTVLIRLSNDGFLQAGVRIKFLYAGEAKEAVTDLLGEASVVYGYKNNETVQALPEQGYPGQSAKLTDATGCPSSGSGQVLGISTENSTASGKRRGQVLGASTFAGTGTSAQDLFSVGISIGLVSMGIGLFLYGKELLSA